MALASKLECLEAGLTFLYLPNMPHYELCVSMTQPIGKLANYKNKQGKSITESYE
jgi:hypothetical protein